MYENNSKYAAIHLVPDVSYLSLSLCPYCELLTVCVGFLVMCRMICPFLAHVVYDWRWVRHKGSLLVLVLRERSGICPFPLQESRLL